MPPNKTLTNFVVNKVRVFDNFVVQIVHKLWNDHAYMFGKHYLLHF